jgi:hypothetical protein
MFPAAVAPPTYVRVCVSGCVPEDSSVQCQCLSSEFRRSGKKSENIQNSTWVAVGGGMDEEETGVDAAGGPRDGYRNVHGM